MKFNGLDGKIYSAHLISQKRDDCSGLHFRGRQLLKVLFPLDEILEEVVLPGSKGLIADFVIPFRRIIVECQGEQHSEYNRHFHKNIFGFGRQLQRDGNKLYWCELNNFKLVYFNYNESNKEWSDKFYS